MDGMTIIAIIGFLMFFSVMAFIFYIQQKNQLSVGKKEVDEANNTKNLVKVDMINQGVIDLGNYQYRAILSCIPQNYSLKSDQERVSFMLQLKQFFDSLPKEISINIQTKEITMDKIVNSINMKKNIIETRYPDNQFIQEYFEQYQVDLKNLPKQYGNTKQKKIYIVIKCNDVGLLDELTAEEKKEEAYRQLDVLSTLIISNLAAANIETRRLNDIQIMEALYNGYNKNGLSNEIFSEGQDFPKVVSSNTAIPVFSDEEYTEYSLYTLQNTLYSGILPRLDKDSVVARDCRRIINELSKVRENFIEESLRKQSYSEED